MTVRLARVAELAQRARESLSLAEGQRLAADADRLAGRRQRLAVPIPLLVFRN